jgi:hypothetical protein
MGAAGSAGAAPPPAKVEKAPSALSDKARELYEEGLRWAGERKWEKAHAAFLAAFTLTGHYQVAGNLGTVELEIGRYREAAEHLALALRGMMGAADVTPKERAAVEEQLARATKQIGVLRVVVSVDGAEVLVDGRPVGAAPLAEAIYVDPGAHVVRARLDGYEAEERSVNVARGAAEDVSIELRKAQGVAAPGEESALRRYRTPVLVGGGGLAALALGGAVVLTVVSNGDASDADDQLEALRASTKERYPCAGAAAPAACMTVRASNEGSDSARNVAIALYATSGVALVGTAAYWFVTRDRPKAEHRVRLDPRVSPDGVGIWAAGTF